jgi:hypothetical protein
MKAFYVTATVLIGLVSIGVSSLVEVGSAAQAPNKSGAFMRVKLDHAQQLLAAIALEDYESISRHSQKISLLTEDENWRVLQTIDYRRHSDDFRRASNAVTDAARKKNLDGAVLAYMQMTMHCVQCHKHVRSQK